MKQKIEKLLNEMPDTEDRELLISHIECLSEEDRNILINAKLRELLPKSFFSGLDKNFKYFCNLIREDLRNEKDLVAGWTGFPGLGKSNDAAIFGAMIDYDYSFKDICFIPSSNEIKKTYLNLPMYSNLHIDEASRGLHKQQWYDKVQQTLNTLYDSVSKDNEICFYDGNEFNRMKIEDMYNYYGENPNNLQVFVIDDNFNVKLKPLKAILRRPIREPKKRMFRIKTRFNKETIVTEDHSLFVFKNRGERLIEVSPKDLCIKDKIIIPKYLPSKEIINEDCNKMQLFGAWLADGSYQYVKGFVASIKLSGKEHSIILDKISKKYPNINNSDIKCYNGVDYMFNNSSLAKEMIDRGFIGYSESKRVPNWVFNTTKENKISFLKGYFTGDGSINYEGRARVSSVNKELLRDIQILLNMLGIVSHFQYLKNKNNYNGVFSNTYSYFLEIPTMFYKQYIYFFEPCKKNYNILKDFIPSKGYMNNKRKQKYIKNESVCAAVTEIEEINYDGYVYDLSVDEIHRFVSNDILHKNTEREGHYLCTTLIMPRFQNFTENFRNFRIKYWIHVIDRGIVIVYKKDEDKDAKDPWHIDENYKMKQKKWRGKRLFEMGIPDIVRMEQYTKNYLFYFKIPALPKKVWAIYQYLKKQSRESSASEESDREMESYQQRLEREKHERWTKIRECKKKGYTYEEIGASIGCSAQTVRRNIRAMEAYDKINMPQAELPHSSTTDNDIINNNLKGINDKNVIPEEFDKI